jgi:hypothetical protein
MGRAKGTHPAKRRRPEREKATEVMPQRILSLPKTLRGL